ncbi:MAG TPA: hypothetical protein VFG89_00850 [Coriobacteriia bacterium]|nr:hypothetical protein [Coriobacteriia bacterium]
MTDETYNEEELDHEDAEDEAEAAVEPRTPLWRSILFGTFVTFAALFFMAVMLYEFGGMSAPDPQLKAQYEQMVAAGYAEPIQARFTIPIPGCKCHSSDPVLTMVHSTRRISECGSCHAR